MISNNLKTKMSEAPEARSKWYPLIIENLRKKGSEELVEILKKRGTGEWSEEASIAAEQILTERGYSIIVEEAALINYEEPPALPEVPPERFTAQPPALPEASISNSAVPEWVMVSCIRCGSSFEVQRPLEVVTGDCPKCSNPFVINPADLPPPGATRGVSLSPPQLSRPQRSNWLGRIISFEGRIGRLQYFYGFLVKLGLLTPGLVLGVMADSSPVIWLLATPIPPCCLVRATVHQCKTPT